MKEKDILKRLVKNDALFRNIHVITQNYDIIPKDKNHMGAYIEFQDLNELREDFLEELIDSIVDWIYSSDKFAELKQKAMVTLGREVDNAAKENQMLQQLRRLVEKQGRSLELTIILMNC